MISYYTQANGINEFHVFNGSLPKPLDKDWERYDPDNEPILGGPEFVVIILNFVTGVHIVGQAKSLEEAKRWVIRYYPCHHKLIKVF